MAPVAAVGDAGGDVGVGTGVEAVPPVPLPPQATSRTAKIRLHDASTDQRVKYCNRVNMINFFLLKMNFYNS
jgi:hypothetical protein